MPYVPSYKTPNHMDKYHEDDRAVLDILVKDLSNGIAQVSKKYGYDGAFLGEMNYALTRLIQELPRSLMATGQTKDETRYWLQAGLFGVLLDVALEYKVRVNEAYEHEQIKKSGDCYDTPYYSKVMEVVSVDGTLIGTIKVNMKRSDDTLNLDVLPSKIVAK